jgi:hypothetical protein
MSPDVAHRDTADGGPVRSNWLYSGRAVAGPIRLILTRRGRWLPNLLRWQTLRSPNDMLRLGSSV